MKKLAYLAVPVLAMALIGSVAMAHSGGVYTAPKVSDSDFTFDGKLDDAGWAKAPVAEINEDKVPAWQMFKTHVNGAALTGPGDCSAVWKAAYSDKYLYFAIDVKDDSYNNTAETPDYNQDTVELWLDGQNVGSDAHEKGVTSQVRMAAATASGKPGLQMGEAGGAWETVQLTDDPSVKLAATVTKVGYVIEVGFPWSIVEEWIGKPTKTIGFDVQINDNDDGSARESIVTWSGGENNNWQNPALMGDLIMQ